MLCISCFTFQIYIYTYLMFRRNYYISHPITPKDKYYLDKSIVFSRLCKI